MNIPESQVQYVDIPEVAETFVDSFKTLTFENGLLRIELCATRMNELKQGTKPTARRYPAVRLVMTGDATTKLINQLNGLMSALTKQGLVKQGKESSRETESVN